MHGAKTGIFCSSLGLNELRWKPRVYAVTSCRLLGIGILPSGLCYPSYCMTSTSTPQDSFQSPFESDDHPIVDVHAPLTASPAAQLTRFFSCSSGYRIFLVEIFDKHEAFEDLTPVSIQLNAPPHSPTPVVDPQNPLRSDSNEFVEDELVSKLSGSVCDVYASPSLINETSSSTRLPSLWSFQSPYSRLIDGCPSVLSLLRCMQAWGTFMDREVISAVIEGERLQYSQWSQRLIRVGVFLLLCSLFMLALLVWYTQFSEAGKNRSWTPFPVFTVLSIISISIVLFGFGMVFYTQGLEKKILLEENRIVFVPT